jgi:hypothetical protein
MAPKRRAQPLAEILAQMPVAAGLPVPEAGGLLIEAMGLPEEAGGLPVEEAGGLPIAEENPSGEGPNEPNGETRPPAARGRRCASSASQAAAASPAPSDELGGDVPVVAEAAGPPNADQVAAPADDGEEQLRKKQRGLIVNAVFRAAADAVSGELMAGAASVGGALLGSISLTVRPARGLSEKMFMGLSITLPARDASRRLKA